MAALGTTTVAMLANQVLQSGTQNLLVADGSSPYFNAGDDPTNILGGIRSTLDGMGFSVAQRNIVLVAVANSPSNPWSSPAMTAGKKLSTLLAFVNAMQTNSRKKANAADAVITQDATQNLLLFIPGSGGGARGPGGGDLNSYLGTQVT